MRHLPLAVLASFFVLGSGACGGLDAASEDAAKQRPASLPGSQCTAVLPSFSPVTDPIPGLSELPGIRLPSEAPASDGYFRPDIGYSEGGQFTSAEDRPEWAVPSSQIAPRAPSGTLRVVEFNTERGNKLSKLIQLMKKINADVWLLNETDLYRNGSGDADSQNVVIGREMAHALGYSYFTGIEFYERRADRRGTSGNTILSRYPLRAGKVWNIPIFENDGGYDWSTSTSEPRCGQRSALSTFIDVDDGAGGQVSLNLVTMHLENKANSKVRQEQYEAVREALVTPGEPTIGAGDFNTITEGSSFRSYLQDRYANDPQDSFFDCSRDDDSNTWSQYFVVNLRLDWMLVQSGADNAVACPAGSYEVVGNSGTSDHQPVVTNMKLSFTSGTTSSSGDSSSSSGGGDPGPTPGSCAGVCGDPGDMGGCYCDDACVDYGDCCPDAQDACGY